MSAHPPPPAASIPGQTSRYHFLDGLRAVLMTYGVFVHAGTLGQWLLLDLMTDLSGLVRMEAFFIVSGFLSHMLVERYGARATVVRRLRSIGIPFLATLILLNPITNWLIYRYHNEPIGLLRYLGGGGSPDAVGPMVWHLHLWFLLSLIAYGLATPISVALIPRVRGLLAALRPERWHPSIRFAAICAVVAGSCLALRVFFEFGLESVLRDTPFLFVTRATLVYFPFFVLGLVLYASRDLLATFSRVHWVQLVASGAIVFGVASAAESLPKPIAEAATLASRAYFATALSSALFRLFQKLVHGRQPAVRYLSDAAYTIYLFHFIVIYALATVLRPVVGDGGTLATLVVVGTVAITIAIHEFAIRRNRMLRAMFNGRFESRATDAESDDRSPWLRRALILSLAANVVVLAGAAAFVQSRGGLPWIRARVERFLDGPTTVESELDAYARTRISLFAELELEPGAIVMLGDSQLDFGEWQELLGPRRVHNRAISGDDARRMLDRLDPIVAGRPSAVVISCGVNDLHRDATPEETIDRLVTAIDRLVEGTEATTVLVLPVFPVNRDMYRRHVSPAFPALTMPPRDAVDRINDALRARALEQPDRVRFVEVPALLDADGELREDRTFDGLHVDGPGHALIAEALRPALASTDSASGGASAD